MTPLNRAKYEEIYAARGMIEQWAASRIVSRITDAEITALRQILNHTRAMLVDVTEVTFDYMKYSETDGLFHLSLIQLCGNAYVTNFYTSLNSHVQILRVLSLGALQRSQETQLEHEAILQSYEERDVNKVETAQATHLEKSRAGVLKALELHESV